MARILFITDELPYPPRNGVTIPSFHLITGLSIYHDVSLLFLKKDSRNIIHEDIEANRSLVNNLWVLEMKSNNPIISLFDEFICVTPFFASDHFDTMQCAHLLDGYDCDVLWATPIGPTVRIPAIERCLSSRRPHLRIAAISDSYTATLRAFGQQIFISKLPIRTRIRCAIAWLRSWGMARMEFKILSKAHYVLVQSKKDKEWVNQISKGQLSENVTILPNGVDLPLLAQPKPVNKPVIGHIGALSANTQARTVRWMIEEVFPILINEFQDAKFALLGKPGSKKLMNLINRTDYISYFPHVDSIEEFYARIVVIVVWNYKCIGVINRTLEAMASGVIVVGEPGAFNGIDGFQHGKHGFIANNTREAADYLKIVLSNESVRNEIKTSARELVELKFNWKKRIDTANLLIENGLNKVIQKYK